MAGKWLTNVSCLLNCFPAAAGKSLTAISSLLNCRLLFLLPLLVVRCQTSLVYLIVGCFFLPPLLVKRLQACRVYFISGCLSCCHCWQIVDKHFFHPVVRYFSCCTSWLFIGRHLLFISFQGAFLAATVGKSLTHISCLLECKVLFFLLLLVNR